MLLIFLVNIHGLFLWKVKKDITVTNAFHKFVAKSGRKPDKKWVDKGKKFYNRSMNHGYKTMI